MKREFFGVVIWDFGLSQDTCSRTKWGFWGGIFEVIIPDFWGGYTTFLGALSVLLSQDWAAPGYLVEDETGISGGRV